MHLSGPQSHHREGSHCFGYSDLNKMCWFQVTVTGHLQVIHSPSHPGDWLQLIDQQR